MTSSTSNGTGHNTAKNVAVINLGCARNLVDSQVILGHLKRNGHHIAEVADSDIAIVNTCGFIEAAKKESIDTILSLLELKKQGKLKKVIVAGCLAQRYSAALLKELSGIDAVIGAQQLDRETLPAQVTLTPAHFAYVKICESCYNQCSFCAIPKIKGKFRSRTMESVIAEVKQLDERGVKELLVIGQDITAYGMDLYKRMSLAPLLKALADVTRNVQWIRLLYTFPAHVTDELIDVIAGEEKICKYIDMPVQHVSDNLLSSMNRGITKQETTALIKKIRDKVPSASIRTTFIVGMPGETPENYRELLNFTGETRFDKVGVFVYSREEGTPAYHMKDQVPESVKKERMNKLMALQRGISKTLQQQKVRQVLKVLIDEQQTDADNVYLGRSAFDAPEVDGLVYVRSGRALTPGEFVEVRITDALEYDLVGDAV